MCVKPHDILLCMPLQFAAACASVITVWMQTHAHWMCMRYILELTCSAIAVVWTGLYSSSFPKLYNFQEPYFPCVSASVLWIANVRFAIYLLWQWTTNERFDLGMCRSDRMSTILRLADVSWSIDQLQELDTLLLSSAKGCRNPYWILEPFQGTS